MQFSNDERHSETLAFLAEVRDYIARWPAIPLNREMLVKIGEHLNNPLHRLICEGEKTRSGGNYTPAGQAVIEVKLNGDKLTIKVPPRGRSVDDWIVLERLRNGETVILKLDPTTGSSNGGLTPSDVASLRIFKTNTA